MQVDRGVKRVNRSIRKNQHNQRGSAMLITTIILLILAVIIASSISLSGMALDLAVFKRNTSNTYYLAESAVEKQVDTMNKSMVTQMSQIIESKIATEYIGDNGPKPTMVKYDTTENILTASDDFEVRLINELHKYIRENYVEVTEPITYEAQSDRIDDTLSTQIKIEVSEKKADGSNLDSGKFRIIATAMTKKGTQVYDEQVVESIVKIDMPTDVFNQIHEYYTYEKWADNSVRTPDILKSPLLCYSDIWVSNKGKLTVKDGDVYVGGAPNTTGVEVEGVTVYPEVDQTGGVIVVNGGEVDFQQNLYCTRNLLVSNGWDFTGDSGENVYERTTKVNIEQDAIAFTIGIVDDFYEKSSNQSPYATSNQVQNTSITIGQNAMVDNDVMIDRWVNGGSINIAETLFGRSGGTGIIEDPNLSSGVFSRGEDCLIAAERMYVAGQPFITFGTEKPKRLLESIGGPFEGLSSWTGYKAGTGDTPDPSYLDKNTSPFASMIETDKIETDFSKSYAIAMVSGIDTSDSNKEKMGKVCNGVFGTNESDVWGFFSQSTNASGKQIGAFMEGTPSADYVSKLNEILGQGSSTNLTGQTKWSTKNLGTVKPATYEGLRGYMTLMRILFYNKCVDPTNVLQENTFGDNIILSKVTPDATSESSTWSYATPIETKAETIDVSNYYVTDGDGENPYPTLIINKDSTKTLTIKASDASNTTLKGWIISAGPVEIKEGIKIEGGIIVGGPEGTVADRKRTFTGDRAGIIVQDGAVEIIYNPNVLLDIKVKNHKLYRQILDALQLTNYATDSLNDIMKEQGDYTKNALKYTKECSLEVDTKDISIVIESLKTK